MSSPALSGLGIELPAPALRHPSPLGSPAKSRTAASDTSSSARRVRIASGPTAIYEFERAAHDWHTTRGYETQVEESRTVHHTQPRQRQVDVPEHGDDDERRAQLERDLFLSVPLSRQPSSAFDSPSPTQSHASTFSSASAVDDSHEDNNAQHSSPSSSLSSLPESAVSAGNYAARLKHKHTIGTAKSMYELGNVAAAHAQQLAAYEQHHHSTWYQIPPWGEHIEPQPATTTTRTIERPTSMLDLRAASAALTSSGAPRAWTRADLQSHQSAIQRDDDTANLRGSVESSAEALYRRRVEEARQQKESDDLGIRLDFLALGSHGPSSYEPPLREREAHNQHPRVRQYAHERVASDGVQHERAITPEPRREVAPRAEPRKSAATVDRKGTLLAACGNSARRSEELSRLLAPKHKRSSSSLSLGGATAVSVPTSSRASTPSGSPRKSRTATTASVSMKEQQHERVSPSLSASPVMLEQAKSKARVDLDLALESTLVVEGSSLKGEIAIRVLPPRFGEPDVMVGKLKVRIVGFEELRSPKTRHLFFHHAAAVESAPLQFAATGARADGEGFFALPPEYYHIPFDVRVPHGKGAKGVWAGKQGDVRYIVIASAKLKARDGSDRSIAHFFRAVELYPWLDPARALAPAETPLSANAEKSMFMGGHGTVKLTASLHRATWLAGQRLYVSARVRNDSNKKVKTLTISLIRTITTFRSRDGGEADDPSQTQSSRKKMAETVLEMGKRAAGHAVTARGGWLGVDKGQSTDFSHFLVVPPDALSIAKGRYLEVSYAVRVAVGAALAADAAVEIPVYVHNFVSIDPPPGHLSPQAASQSPEVRASPRKSLAKMHSAFELRPESVAQQPSRAPTRSNSLDSLRTSALGASPAVAAEALRPLPRPPTTRPMQILERARDLQMQRYSAVAMEPSYSVAPPSSYAIAPDDSASDPMPYTAYQDPYIPFGAAPEPVVEGVQLDELEDIPEEEDDDDHESDEELQAVMSCSDFDAALAFEAQEVGNGERRLSVTASPNKNEGRRRDSYFRVATPASPVKAAPPPLPPSPTKSTASSRSARSLRKAASTPSFRAQSSPSVPELATPSTDSHSGSSRVATPPQAYGDPISRRGTPHNFERDHVKVLPAVRSKIQAMETRQNTLASLSTRRVQRQPSKASVMSDSDQGHVQLDALTRANSAVRFKAPMLRPHRH